MKNEITKKLVINACIAAIYIVLTIILPIFSYDYIQIRLSEALVLLCFYNKKYSSGILIGCFIANLIGPFGFIDAIVGTISTLIAIVLMRYCKKVFIASLMPVISVVIVAVEIAMINGTLQLFWLIWGSMLLGEFVAVSIIGVFVFKIIEQNRWLNKELDLKNRG